MFLLRTALLIPFFYVTFLAAQGLNDWQIITYMNDVTGVVSLENHIWAGTSGGVYRFYEPDNKPERFTNLAGLASLKITAIITDQQYGRIIAGSSDGIINLCPVEWWNGMLITC